MDICGKNNSQKKLEFCHITSMSSKKRKHYNNLSYNNLKDIYSQIASGPSNNEQRTMNKAQMKILKRLKTHRIYLFPDFCLILKTSGMNYKDISKFLMGLVDYIDIDYIRLRLCNKSNNSVKNMLFTWIAFQYSNKVIEYIDLLTSTNQLILKNNIDLKYEFQIKIEQIKQQCINNNYNFVNQAPNQNIKRRKKSQQLIDDNTNNANSSKNLQTDEINNEELTDNLSNDQMDNANNDETNFSDDFFNSSDDFFYFLIDDDDDKSCKIKSEDFNFGCFL